MTRSLQRDALRQAILYQERRRLLIFVKFELRHRLGGGRSPISGRLWAIVRCDQDPRPSHCLACQVDMDEHTWNPVFCGTRSMLYLARTRCEHILLKLT